MPEVIKKNLVYIVAMLLVVGGFVWLSVKFLKPKSNTLAVQATNNQFPQGNGQSGGWAGRGNGQGRGNFAPPVHGTIKSISGSTIVMTADDGSTKNVTTSADTRITEMTNGQRTELALSDLTNGEEISVMNSGTDTTNLQARMIIIGTFTPGQNRGSWSGGSSSSPSDSRSQPSDGANSL